MDARVDHPCPAGCGESVPWDRLACPGDWARLPATIKAEVWRSWQHRHDDPDSHRAALAVAAGWFDQHPTGASP